MLGNKIVQALYGLHNFIVSYDFHIFSVYRHNTHNRLDLIKSLSYESILLYRLNKFLYANPLSIFVFSNLANKLRTPLISPVLAYL